MPAITDTSNLPAIYDAVFNTAKAVAAGWTAEYQGLWPDNAQIKTGPVLVVPYPQFAGFGLGGIKRGKEDITGSQLLDMFWQIDCYCVCSYAATNPNTWKTPLTAMGALVRALRADRYFGNTCFNSKIVDPHLMEWADKVNPAVRFFGCVVSVEVFEQVLTPET